MKLFSIVLLTAASAAVAAPAFAGQCRDPWVTQAVREVTGRESAGQGEFGECNIKLYGNGSWSSYPDLLGKVRARYPRMGAAAGVAGAAGVLQPRPGVNGAGLIGQDGGSLIGNDSGSFRR